MPSQIQPRINRFTIEAPLSSWECLSLHRSRGGLDAKAARELRRRVEAAVPDMNVVGGAPCRRWRRWRVRIGPPAADRLKFGLTLLYRRHVKAELLRRVSERLRRRRGFRWNDPFLLPKGVVMLAWISRT